jgi:hypothetical protein
VFRTDMRFVAVLAVAALFSTGAVAQVNPVPDPPKEQNAPEHFDSQAEKSKRNNETLSDRLDRTDGVIHPPVNVDPKIHEAPPPTGDRGIVIPAPPSGSNPAPK